jgi:hypothetical protein
MCSQQHMRVVFMPGMVNVGFHVDGGDGGIGYPLKDQNPFFGPSGIIIFGEG